MQQGKADKRPVLALALEGGASAMYTVQAL